MIEALNIVFQSLKLVWGCDGKRAVSSEEILPNCAKKNGRTGSQTKTPHGRNVVT